MTPYDLTVTYLKEMAGGKLVLTSQQMEQVIGKSAKQQSEMRKKGTLDVPYKNIGRNVVYSIFEVAEYLTNFKKEQEEYKEEKTEKVKIRYKKKSADDMSHLFYFEKLQENVLEKLNFYENYSIILEELKRSEDREIELKNKILNK